MNNHIDLSYEEKFIKDSLGYTERVSVYKKKEYNKDQLTYYSGFIKKGCVEKALQSYTWDIFLGTNSLGFIKTPSNKKDVSYQYYSYHSEECFPIIFTRSFDGTDDRYTEPLQEFCLFFNLYEDKNKRIHYQIDEGGEFIEVIRTQDDSVEIKLKYLKNFAAAKKLSIVIFFHGSKYTPNIPKDNTTKAHDQVTKEQQYHYTTSRYINEQGSIDTIGYILGKKIIQGTENYDPFPKKQHEEFIVGVDANGIEIYCSCDHKKINEHKISRLTPISFNKEVLKKYYDHGSKYTVTDGRIHHRMWSMPIDNNHNTHVVVFLCDLMQLPHKEQLHWKSYNIIGTGKISNTYFQRSFMCEWINPEQPDLYFKSLFTNFQEKRYSQYGYNLFMPLNTEDDHYFNQIHIPLTNELKEFEEQVLSLSKTLIDSINEKEISKNISISPQDKGIKKMEKFLISEGVTVPEIGDALRDLQSLRSSSVAHRKGKKYESIKEKFQIGKLEYSSIFRNILISCIKILNTIDKHLLH